ncbi:MAG: hypothetical protein GTO63_22860 [Anaerolineae bacterium]|nr:hypothetical protein [Anaerolineae bacterium]
MALMSKTLGLVVASIIVAGASMAGYLLWNQTTQVGEISPCELGEERIEGDRVTAEGTIVFNSFEGGFYGIVGDEEGRYDPVNLGDEYKVEGLRVHFVARILENQGSIHMWGLLVEILEIEESQQQNCLVPFIQP